MLFPFPYNWKVNISSVSSWLILWHSNHVPTFLVLSDKFSRDLMGFYSFWQIKLYWLNLLCCCIPPKLDHYVINWNMGSLNPFRMPLGFYTEKNDCSCSLRTGMTCWRKTKRFFSDIKKRKKIITWGRCMHLFGMLSCFPDKFVWFVRTPVKLFAACHLVCSCHLDAFSVHLSPDYLAVLLAMWQKKMDAHPFFNCSLSASKCSTFIFPTFIC